MKFIELKHCGHMVLCQFPCFLKLSQHFIFSSVLIHDVGTFENYVRSTKKLQRIAPRAKSLSVSQLNLNSNRSGILRKRSTLLLIPTNSAAMIENHLPDLDLLDLESEVDEGDIRIIPSRFWRFLNFLKSFFPCKW